MTMPGLSVCHCLECHTDFSLPSEAVEGVDSVSCPICQQDVPVQEVEAVDLDEEEDEEEDEDEDDE